MRPTPARISTVVLVAALVPVVVGGMASEPKKPEAPKPAEAKLTVDLTADAWKGDGGRVTRHVLLTAAGPPPQHPVQLVDGHGRNVTSATPVDKARCASASTVRRSTGLTQEGLTTAWCLEVVNLRAGSAVTGVLKAEKSTVTVTLALRHRWLLAFLVALLGFAAGAGFPSVVPLVVAVSRRSEVDGLLDDNDAASSPHRIAGLRSWVERQRGERSQPDAVLLPLVQRVVEQGPVTARRARADLRAAIGRSGLPPGTALRVDAEQEADRETHDIADFYDDERKPGAHPADTLAQVVGRMQKVKAHLDLAGRRLDSVATVPPDLQQGLDAAVRFFARATAADVDALETSVKELHKKIDAVAPLPGGDRALAAFGTVSDAVPDASRWLAVSLPPVPRSAAALLRWAVILLTGVVAVGAVMLSVYSPSETFGTAGDYIKVFTTAAGSAALATVTTILRWRSVSPSASEA